MMNLMECAALQLYDYNLIPIPLKGKMPLIDRWSTRFINDSMKRQDIIKGFITSKGKYIRFREGGNIGILTGKISNVIILDIDRMELLRELEKIEKTWTVKTGRGVHYYFRYQEGIPSMQLMPGIDILSDKKIAVAPPSTHPKGIKYKWIVSPKEISIKEPPAWLIGQIVKKTNSNILYKKTSNIVNNNTLIKQQDWYSFYHEYLSDIKDNGQWVTALCPFHNDNHRSFSFNRFSGGWICFAGCGKGSVTDFIDYLNKIASKHSNKKFGGEMSV